MLPFVGFASSLTLCLRGALLCVHGEKPKLSEQTGSAGKGNEDCYITSLQDTWKESREGKHLFCFDKRVSRLRPACECLRVAAVKMFGKQTSRTQPEQGWLVSPQYGTRHGDSEDTAVISVRQHF